MSETGSKSTDRQNIEVWNDLVSPKDLVVCLLISVVCAVVNCLLVVPKRDVVIVDESRVTDEADSADAEESDAR